MKSIYIGVNKANMIDDRGVIHTAIKQGNVWILNGITYSNPFKAFMSVERR